MKQKLLLIIIFSMILLLPLISADMGPKPTVEVHVTYDGEKVQETEFPSVMLVCYSSATDSYDRDIISELKINQYDAARECYWRPNSMALGSTCELSTCVYTNYLPREFKVAVYLSSLDKTFVSDAIKRDNFRSEYQLSLGADGSANIAETTSFFKYTKLRSFVVALIITLAVELLFTLAFFRKTKVKKKILLYVFIANLISLPIVWFLFPLLGIEIWVILLAEAFAIVFEAYFIEWISKKKISFKKALILSIVVNVASFLIGCFFYLTFRYFLLLYF